MSYIHSLFSKGKLFTFITCIHIATGTLMADVAVESGDYAGSRSVSGGGITATEPWLSDNLTIEWDIILDNTTKVFTYTYDIYGDSETDLSKEISHFIIELSEGFTEDNFVGGAPSGDIEITTFAENGPSNPNMPDDIYGIKFDLEEDLNTATVTLTFQTLRIPVWGDFYAKSGKNEQQDTYAYNRDFGIAPVINGDYSGFIARPDTVGVIPEPQTYAIMGGMLALTALIRRRQQHAANIL